MKNVKTYTVNTREGERVSFDFESEEFTLTVMQDGDDCTVIDHEEHQLYNVRKTDPAQAVAAYLDWMYGILNEWDADPDEFGEYERGTAEFWAHEFCAIIENTACEWDFIGEG